MKTAPIARVVLLVLVVASIGVWAFKTWGSTAAAPAGRPPCAAAQP